MSPHGIRPSSYGPIFRVPGPYKGHLEPAPVLVLPSIGGNEIVPRPQDIEVIPDFQLRDRVHDLKIDADAIGGNDRANRALLR